MEFSNTPENLNVATALEIRRTGNWLFPTLDGEPRTRKPPLTAWLTAAAIRSSTLDALNNHSAAVRTDGYRRLAWDVRWPALLACCATFVAVFVLGAMIGGARLGWASSIICASTFYFLRYARVSSVDVHLTLWVTTANAFLAAALLRRRLWMGCAGAGVAIGLAFMSKGPVALTETVVPFAAYALWQARWASARRPSLSAISPVILGVVVCLLVALPWFLAVLAREPSHQWHV
ncbi:MAG TPA: phospholipid carrier-dependent glycosyltransferase, partial [Humisphaera sp.]|nr:phospholipid carrier-dependent glycosyltransferase [Humisphaera sp.]